MPLLICFLGNIASFGQGQQPVEVLQPLQDFRTYFARTTGALRIPNPHVQNDSVCAFSLEGTYRDRYKHAYNKHPAVSHRRYCECTHGRRRRKPLRVTQTALSLPRCQGGNSARGNPFAWSRAMRGPGGPVDFLGFPECVQSVASRAGAGCSNTGHLFNPLRASALPGISFGNGKTRSRGGYGIFLSTPTETKRNTEGMEGQSSRHFCKVPRRSTSSATKILDCPQTCCARPQFPLGYTSIPNHSEYGLTCSNGIWTFNVNCRTVPCLPFPTSAARARISVAKTI